MKEADRLLLKDGHGDLASSERRHRISQHIWHVEHWKRCHGARATRAYPSVRSLVGLCGCGGVTSGRLTTHVVLAVFLVLTRTRTQQKCRLTCMHWDNSRPGFSTLCP